MVSYSVANVLLGRVSTRAPYWYAVGIDLLALLVAGRIAMQFCRSATEEHASRAAATSR
jgi:hypothetical protein